MSLSPLSVLFVFLYGVGLQAYLFNSLLSKVEKNLLTYQCIYHSLIYVLFIFLVLNIVWAEGSEREGSKY